MSTSVRSSGHRPRFSRWFLDRSVRTKILGVVGLTAVVSLAGAVLASEQLALTAEGTQQLARIESTIDTKENDR